MYIYNMATSNLNDVEFNYQYDLEEQTHSYPCTNLEYLSVSDLNNQSYSNGYINFSNLVMVGQSSEKFLDFASSYLVIPITYTLTAQNAYFGTCTGVNNGVVTSMNPNCPENAFGCGMKGWHNLIDTAMCKFSGISINRSSSHLNFFQNEVLKKQSLDEQRLLGEIFNYSLDSSESLRTQVANNRVVEFNNSTQSQTVNLASGHTPSSFCNNGHIKRMLKNNLDLANSNLPNQGVSANTLSNSFQSCYLGPVSPDANGLCTQLRYVANCIVPLKYVSDFYARIASVQSTSGFELRVQSNATAGNSWTYNFNIPTPANFGANSTVPSSAMTNISVSSLQNHGRTCPFIISPPNVGNLGSGLTLFPSTFTAGAGNSAACSVTVTSQIGYNVTTNSLSQRPCQLIIPLITYAPSYVSTILRQPAFKMLYKDYYIDQITSVQQGSNVSRMISTQIARPRTIHILPFLSTANLGNSQLSAPCPPYQMCTSSAPQTVSNVKLRNLNITIGGTPIFTTPLNYNYEYYNNHVLKLIAREVANGNSSKSQFHSGAITQKDWELAYGVYSFNLEKVSDQEQDNQQKSFMVNWQVESCASNLSWDFIIICEYEQEIYLDRASGQITSA